jgi:hypothetical protein
MPKKGLRRTVVIGRPGSAFLAGAAKRRVKQALALRRLLTDTRTSEKKINYNGTPHTVEEFASQRFFEGDRTQWMQRLL